MAEKRELRQRGRGVLRRQRGKKKKRRRGKERKKEEEEGDSRRREIPVALPAEGKNVDLLPLYARTSIFKKKKVNIRPYLVF